MTLLPAVKPCGGPDKGSAGDVVIDTLVSDTKTDRQLPALCTNTSVSNPTHLERFGERRVGCIGEKSNADYKPRLPHTISTTR